MVVTAKVYRLVKKFEGVPADHNISLTEETLSELEDGEVLFEAVYLSVDPYMRFMMDLPLFPEGSVMIGEQVARVAESKNPAYQVGQHYLVSCGWRTHTIVNPDDGQTRMKPLPENLGDLPLSLALGTVGMTGATAYNALINEMNIHPGKSIYINAASGATGQVACQIAKIKGLKVIASAGSDEKCSFLQSLGVDHVFNYKKDSVSEALQKAAPEGIKYFLDGVGGIITTDVINNNMAFHGQIVHIGSISQYNKQPPLGELPYMTIMTKRLTFKGRNIFDCPENVWNEAHKNILNWIKEGKLQYKEHVTEGFENMRQAFYELLTGGNFGKAVVKI